MDGCFEILLCKIFVFVIPIEILDSKENSTEVKLTEKILITNIFFCLSN